MSDLSVSNEKYKLYKAKCNIDAFLICFCLRLYHIKMHLQYDLKSHFFDNELKTIPVAFPLRDFQSKD